MSRLLKCSNCNKENVPLLACGMCLQVQYCSRNCQKSHWISIHKDLCKPHENYKPTENYKDKPTIKLYSNTILNIPIHDNDLKNIDIDSPGSDGRTLLSIACREGSVYNVKKLLDHGSNPTQTRPNGEQPIITSSRAGHIDIVRILVSRGGNINCKMVEGWTPLLMICAKGHDFIKEFIEDFGADPNLAMEGGATPILVAASRNYYKIVESLIKYGANPDIPMHGGATPLLVSAQSGHINSCRSLLLHDANIEKAMDNGGRPLYIAAQNNHLDVIKILVEFGADIVAITAGFRAIDIAHLRGNTEVVKYLESVMIKKHHINLDIVIKSIVVGVLPLDIIQILYKISKDDMFELQKYVDSLYQDMISCHAACCYGEYLDDSTLSIIGQDYDGPLKQLVMEYLVPQTKSREIIKQIKFILDNILDEIDLEEMGKQIRHVYAQYVYKV